MRHTSKGADMRRLTIPALLAAALVLPAAAAAKGPSSATISGPGLDKTIRVSGNGEYITSRLGHLTEQAGFFPAAFGQSPNPMLPSRPKGNLGPKLTIHYVVPGGDNTTFRIVQDVYPYAAGGAVTYMKPGQNLFGMTTHGGWLRAYGLKRTLVRLGLRAHPPASSSHASLAWLGIPGALVLAGIAFTMRRRRAA
jgi:hypothetical protein